MRTQLIEITDNTLLKLVKLSKKMVLKWFANMKQPVFGLSTRMEMYGQKSQESREIITQLSSTFRKLYNCG